MADSIEEQLFHRNMRWFRGGLVLEAHMLLYHSTLGLRVIKKKKKPGGGRGVGGGLLGNSTEICGGSEAGSYLRLIDSCITQLKAQGPSRTCAESKEEEEESQLPRYRLPEALRGIDKGLRRYLVLFAILCMQTLQIRLS